MTKKRKDWISLSPRHFSLMQLRSCVCVRARIYIELESDSGYIFGESTAECHVGYSRWLSHLQLYTHRPFAGLRIFLAPNQKRVLIKRLVF